MTNELDKISQLPGHLTDQILSRLPIKDAVRTSILSRDWRYKWSSLPQLVFDDQCTRGVPSLQRALNENLVKIIDEVLLLHIGPIQKFMLSHKGFCVTRNIDHWILHLSRVSAKEIILHIWIGQKYKIPSSLFNCQYLIRLELYNCSVKIPSKFDGFKKLKNLVLHRVELSRDGLEAMISRCPLLNILKLMSLQGITRVNIKAPNLKWLYLQGAFLDVTFDDMNSLKLVMLKFYADNANKHGPSNANLSNLHKYFLYITKTHSLMLIDYSLKYFAARNVPQTLPNALIHLKYIFACIDFNNVEEILTIMCLIRSSPQLKRVDFQSRAEEQQATQSGTMAGFWEHNHACFLEQVTVVSMGRISGSEPEQKFMKVLLASSPNLQTMTIRPHSTSGEGKLLKELLRFKRALAQVEVIFLDPVNAEANLQRGQVRFGDFFYYVF